MQTVRQLPLPSINKPRSISKLHKPISFIFFSLSLSLTQQDFQRNDFNLDFTDVTDLEIWRSRIFDAIHQGFMIDVSAFESVFSMLFCFFPSFFGLFVLLIVYSSFLRSLFASYSLCIVVCGVDNWGNVNNLRSLQ